MNTRFRTRYPFMNQADPGGGGGGAAPTPPGPAAAPAAPAPAPASSHPWLGDNPDAELLGHVQNAGWKSPADAVAGHRNLEKLLGADRAGRTVVLPKDDATPAEWSDFYTKLGRPGTPDDYKLPVPEGADPAFSKAAATWMHEAGIPAKQAQALATKWNEHMATQAQAAAQAEQDALGQEHAALAKDWGNEAPMRRELARRAAQQLGLDEAAIDALEKVGGYSKTMKALAKMGDLMREHGAEGLGEMGSFGMTPEGAKAKRTQLMADKDWRTKAMVNNSAEWAELQKLDRLIAGQQ
jgi:hypothetical protein